MSLIYAKKSVTLFRLANLSNLGIRSLIKNSHHASFQRAICLARQHSDRTRFLSSNLFRQNSILFMNKYQTSHLHISSKLLQNDSSNNNNDDPNGTLGNDLPINMGSPPPMNQLATIQQLISVTFNPNLTSKNKFCQQKCLN